MMTQLENDLLKFFQFLDRPNLHNILFGCMGRYEVHVSEKQLSLLGDQENLPTRIVFYLHGNNEKFSVHFKNSKATKVLVENLSSSKIEEIKATITSAQIKVERFGYEVLFSSHPVKGYFKYSDKFQIMPVPEGSERPVNTIADLHPFILEYKYLGFQDPFLNSNIKHSVVNELYFLFNTFLMTDFTIHDNVIRNEWGIELNSDSSKACTFFQVGYRLSNYKFNDTSFSNVEHLSQLAQVSAEEYLYWGKLRFFGMDDFIIPDYFTSFLDKYFSILEEDKKGQLKEAMYWFEMAQQNEGKSISATSLFIAMSLEKLSKETVAICGSCSSKGKRQKPMEIISELVKKEYSKTELDQIIVDSGDSYQVFYCVKCNKIIRKAKSSSLLMKELLDTHYPSLGEFAAKERNNFYSAVRSRIAHGGMLEEDKESLFYNDYKEQSERAKMFLNINQYVLIRWFYTL